MGISIIEQILMPSKVLVIRPWFIKEISLLNVSPVNKLISFINHGLIACTLLGINICSKIASIYTYKKLRMTSSTGKGKKNTVSRAIFTRGSLNKGYDMLH